MTEVIPEDIPITQPEEAGVFRMDRHFETVLIDKYGGLLLGCSNLTGRYWKGSLWYFENPTDAPDPEKCTSTIPTDEGVTDVQWYGDMKCMVGLNCGQVNFYENHFYQSKWQFSDTPSCKNVHTKMITSLSLNCDLTKAVSGSADCSVKVWDMNTGSTMSSSKGHWDGVNSVAFHSGDPNVFLSCGLDGQVVLWDIRKSKPASVVKTDPLDSIPTCVEWLPSGESFVVAGQTGMIVCKKLQSKDVIHSSKPHIRDINRMKFYQGTNLLATVSNDCTVVVTNVKDGTRVYDDKSHTDFVRGAAWGEKGELYTCGWDSQVKVHSIGGQENGIDMEQTNSMEVNS